jgi:CDP-4-dehydro-6-deoxyglucose reductase
MPESETFNIRVFTNKGVNKDFSCLATQTVLDAAKQRHCFIPSACTNGVCEVCYGDLHSGTIILNNGEVISAPPIRQNVLYCIATPLTDLTIGIKAFRGPGEFKLQTLACQIEQVSQLNDDIYKVELLTPAGKQPEFHAGQYLELLPEDGNSYPFTIACAPQGRLIELHIQVHQENQGAQYILSQLQNQKTMRVKLPMGNCYLPIERHTLQNDVLLIAAGTGFAQMKSLIEALKQETERPNLHLFWVGKQPSDLYANELAQSWHDEGLINYYPIVRDTQQGWDGYSGLIEDLILEQFDNLKSCSAFFCGSPNFVYGILDALAQDGLPQEQCYSDVFDYAPRS